MAFWEKSDTDVSDNEKSRDVETDAAGGCCDGSMSGAMSGTCEGSGCGVSNGTSEGSGFDDACGTNYADGSDASSQSHKNKKNKKSRKAAKSGSAIGTGENRKSGSEETSKKPGKIAKFFRCVLAFVIAVCVVWAGISIYRVAGGYKGTVRKLFSATQRANFEQLTEITSSVALLEWGCDEEQAYDEVKKNVNAKLNDIEDNLGAIKKISYEVTDETEWSYRRVKAAQELLEDKYQAENLKLKKVVAVDVEITIKGAKETKDYSIHNLYLIKEKSGWKAYIGELEYE